MVPYWGEMQFFGMDQQHLHRERVARRVGPSVSTRGLAQPSHAFADAIRTAENGGAGNQNTGPRVRGEEGVVAVDPAFHRQLAGRAAVLDHLADEPDFGQDCLDELPPSVTRV